MEKRWPPQQGGFLGSAFPAKSHSSVNRTQTKMDEAVVLSSSSFTTVTQHFEKFAGRVYSQARISGFPALVPPVGESNECSASQQLRCTTSGINASVTRGTLVGVLREDVFSFHASCLMLSKSSLRTTDFSSLFKRVWMMMSFSFGFHVL